MIILLLFLTGQDLRNELKSQFYPQRSTEYYTSRVVMYNEADCYKNMVYLLYSGGRVDWTCHAQIIPNSATINAEHIVPQSLFKEKLPMRADLHHLYSSGAKENNYRSNFPFTEVPYASCIKFGKNNTWFETMPSNPDDYSCYTQNPIRAFMPIKKDRGIVARAVLYFQTIYPDVDISSINNISLFKKWNEEYPPSELEIFRNEIINITQGNRNPYIDNPVLVNRAFP